MDILAMFSHLCICTARLKAHAQSSKIATTKLKGFALGQGGGWWARPILQGRKNHLPSTNFLHNSTFKFQKIPTLMGLV